MQYKLDTKQTFKEYEVGWTLFDAFIITQLVFSTIIIYYVITLSNKS